MSWSGSVNPCTSDLCLSRQGSDVLWAAFSLFAASAIVVLIVAHSRTRGHRAFHLSSAAVLVTASVSYFIMASNLGNTPIPVEFRGATAVRTTRSIFYARYVDWAITTPLLLLILLLSTGLPLSMIFFTIFIDVVMIVSGLIAALVATRYKWGLFSIGCACLIYIWYILLVVGRQSAYRLGNDYGRAYFRGAIYQSTLWLVYPIIFGCSEGGNVIRVTSEVIAYAVLDLLAKVVFTAVHLYSMENLDYDRYGFTSGKIVDSVPASSNTKERSSLDHEHQQPTADRNKATTDTQALKGGGQTVTNSPQAIASESHPPFHQLDPATTTTPTTTHQSPQAMTA